MILNLTRMKKKEMVWPNVIYYVIQGVYAEHVEVAVNIEAFIIFSSEYT